jgi:hypothetical protein
MIKRRESEAEYNRLVDAGLDKAEDRIAHESNIIKLSNEYLNIIRPIFEMEKNYNNLLKDREGIVDNIIRLQKEMLGIVTSTADESMQEVVSLLNVMSEVNPTAFSDLLAPILDKRSSRIFCGSCR